MRFKVFVIVFTLSILMLLPTSVLSADRITIENLEKLEALPAEYEAYTYAQRVEWLTNTINQSTNPVNNYRLNRELAFQHIEVSANDLADAACQSTPPEIFDLTYRFVCLSALKNNDDIKLVKLLELQKDAFTESDITIAAETLSLIAWVQSSTGDIEQAFNSYEIALPLAEQVSVYLLNDITLNLATLYIVHGDDEYVTKGINLILESINRLNIMRQEEPNAANYVARTLARIHFNLGIAYTLHRSDYKEALKWFGLIDPEVTILRESVLVFSSLAYAELGNSEQAKQYLQQSFSAPSSALFNSDYLQCYQQLIQVKLAISFEINDCEQLNENTVLEVQLDLFKRMIESSYSELSMLGLKKFYALYLNRLRPLLKQNSAKSASRAELSRLQQESRLKGELIEKEKALTAATKAKVDSQHQLTIAIILVFLLIILLVLLQLKQKQKLANQFAKLSLFDRLTGLHNRYYFEQNIEREISFVKRAKDDNKYNPIAIYLLI